MNPLDNFLKLLDTGKDSALLRFSIGNEYLKRGDHADAIAHLRAAIEKDAKYSAAWKLLGKALADAGDFAEAARVYAQGIAIADAKGDKQAAKEMTVFLKRAQKHLPESQ